MPKPHFSSTPVVPLQAIQHPLLRARQVTLVVKREDQLHALVSGNKWRKLKYNIAAAKHSNRSGILTFGGAYSNHLVASAAAASDANLPAVGIVRGEEHRPLNPTLARAQELGMQLQYVSREAYRNKLELEKEFLSRHPQAFIIPEGGSNALAVKGCAEMLAGIDIEKYDYYALACGTGGTLAGLLEALSHRQQALGFPALKGGSFLKAEVDKLNQAFSGKQYHNFQLITDYHFGGYAKWKPELLEFIRDFYREQGIPLDPVYTGKMMYGLLDMVKQSRFKPGTRILALHTGGLQGIGGFNQRFGTSLADS